ncbi:unnamed protein product [Effrenium voratum]|uniref:Protein C10 n=1 Tax=Effrenium voratum TaxID=2562239 RepID=A0AA36JAF1_9DINO|nr:unnamed protein product [Effrenium voratum]
MPPPPPELTLQEVLDLQVSPGEPNAYLKAELYDGFSDPDFQEALAELEAIHGKAYKNYTEDHTKLFLTVQNKVLPRYGFKKGQVGVMQMLSVGARFNDNEEFCNNRAVLNELIGMAPALADELEELAPKKEKREEPAPLITEHLRLAPTLTTASRQWQPPSQEESRRFQLADDLPAAEGM